MSQEYKSDREELTAHVAKLQALLADPHPGLSTWMEEVADLTDEIAKFSPRYTFQLMDAVRKMGSYLTNDEIVRLVNKEEQLKRNI